MSSRNPDNPMYADPDSPDRTKDFKSAGTLKPGDNHYRAYVGPPGRFDFMSATQFALLFHLGLRETHNVLDFGCGSLRLGRLLIPYLRPGRYFGIDPNEWLIEDGIRKELGQQAVNLKKPEFAFNDDFDCGVFGRKFHFNMAQSIASHMGPDLFARYLSSARETLAGNGLIAFTVKPPPEPGLPVDWPEDGWHYPVNVPYSEDLVMTMISNAGLIGKAIPWYHPGQAWYLAARNENRLPPDELLHHLSGAVFGQKQFADSLTPDEA